MYTLKIIKSHLDSHTHALCTAHRMHFIAMGSDCTCSVDCIVLILLGEKLINWIWIRLRLMPRACNRYLYRYKQRTLQYHACIHLYFSCDFDEVSSLTNIIRYAILEMKFFRGYFTIVSCHKSKIDLHYLGHVFEKFVIGGKIPVQIDLHTWDK